MLTVSCNVIATAHPSRYVHEVVSARHHLVVCTSCRQPGEAKEPRASRSGALLYRSLSHHFARWAQREGFVITPYECLSACPRPCAIALQAPGKYTYVFGDMKPGESESAVIECASLYRRATVGFLPREERPHALRAAILARIPPAET